jgi:hypothetical protein
MIRDAILKRRAKNRTTIHSTSNILQAPRYDRSYSVQVAAVGGLIIKFSVQTNETNAFVTLFVNDRALPDATNIPVSETVASVELKDTVKPDDAITLIINSVEHIWPPEGTNGPHNKKRWKHHHHHHEPPETPPPLIGNLSYTLLVER